MREMSKRAVLVARLLAAPKRFMTAAAFAPLSMSFDGAAAVRRALLHALLGLVAVFDHRFTVASFVTCP